MGKAHQKQKEAAQPKSETIALPTRKKSTLFIESKHSYTKKY
jgi:hypothetical protein